MGNGSRISILFVSGSSSLQSGAELRMLETANYFEGEGHKTYVAVPNPDSEEEKATFTQKSKSIVNFYPLTRPHRPLTFAGAVGYGYRALRSILNLVKLIRKHNVDIVHVNEFFDLPGLIAGKLAGAKTICHTRVIMEEPKWLKKMLLLFVTRFADRIICVSEAVKDKMFTESRFDSEKIELIYNPGPDRERFNPGKCSGDSNREELGLSENNFAVGLISKFTENKGQINLVKAAKLIKEEGVEDITYLLVGGKVSGHEHYYEKVFNLAQEEGLGSQINFLGYRDDIPQIISSCDVMVHVPVHHDPLPGVVLEAMAMKRPIIGTRSGGIPEEFEDGKSGILIPRDDPQSLAEEILDLYEDKQKRKELGREARKYLDHNFSWNKYLSQSEDVYEGLVE